MDIANGVTKTSDTKIQKLITDDYNGEDGNIGKMKDEPWTYDTVVKDINKARMLAVLKQMDADDSADIVVPMITQTIEDPQYVDGVTLDHGIRLIDEVYNGLLENPEKKQEI